MTKTADVVVGGFVLAGIAALLFLAIQVSDISQLSGNRGYSVSALFENVAGLKPRAPVSMAGVRIGRVAAIDLDGDSFQAIVTMSLDAGFSLPIDSSASILTAGLLGEKYIGIQPGAEEDVLQDGGEIELTQSALILERLVGEFLFRNSQD